MIFQQAKAPKRGCLGGNERVAHLEQPRGEAAVFRVAVSPGDLNEQLEFGFQRDCGRTADDQPNDEQEKEQPDSFKESRREHNAASV